MQRQALYEQASGYLRVGGEDECGIKLLAVAHVVLQGLGYVGQGLAVCVVQGHYALVGLLAGQAVLGVERDGALAAACACYEFGQGGVAGYFTYDGGCSA